MIDLYKKGRRLDWWVDAEEYSITDMEKDVFKHLASYQEVNFWDRIIEQFNTFVLTKSFSLCCELQEWWSLS
jgi:hypothetical protein